MFHAGDAITLASLRLAANFSCHTRQTCLVLISKERESTMRRLLALILGAALAANGLFMLANPTDWYGLVPGVPTTGPLNGHFVRDIGCAYLVAGAGLAAFGVDARARAAALAAAAFLALHALVHLWDWASGREALALLVDDLPAVFAPPAIALWLAWPSSTLRKENHHAEMADPAAHRRV
jgi:hypothetical protein